jgi:hypothetical protein
MRKAIAFTAAVLASLQAADAFAISPVPVAALRANSISASVAVPRLRAAGGLRTVSMAQTFTESETWKKTDIPSLLKEGASFFLEEECKFTPTAGGVNNLVQYCETSSVMSLATC